VKDVAVRLSAGSEVRETTISLAQEESVMLQARIPAPDDAEVTIALTSPGTDPISRSVSMNRADIVVDRIYTEPKSPKAGEELRFFAEVRNVGKAPITDFSVQFHVDDYKDYWVTWGCIYGETKLEPGKSLPIGGGFLWKAAPGRHRVRAWANPDGSRESHYSNNIRWEELTVE
jgi:hypothetical protein